MGKMVLMSWGIPSVASRKVQEKNEHENTFEIIPTVPLADACSL
jgi:hypothetical protein